MIQNIAPFVFHNEYEHFKPSEHDCIFVFRGRELLLCEPENGGVEFPTIGEFLAAYHPDSMDDIQYLFRIDDAHYYLWRGVGEVEIPGYTYTNIGILRKQGPMELEFAGMTANHLYVWYRDNRYCGRCGKKMSVDQKERAMRCTCGNIVYPKICPAVIVGVTDGDKIVVTRYAGRAYKGYALIAGFCEIGEMAEETVKREVMEEVGLKVKNIRYFSSQPWGFESDLLLGYYCEVDGDTTIRRDPEELAVAEWQSREELEPVENTLSLTATMIEHFRNGGQI